MRISSFRPFFALVFAVLFFLLTSVLFAEAQMSELTDEQIEQLESASLAPEKIFIDSTESIFPIHEMTEHPGFAQEKAKRPWYEQNPEASERVFRQSGLEKNVIHWDMLKKDFLLKDLETLTLAKLVSIYPEFDGVKIKRAQEEVRRIKAELANEVQR